MILKYLDKDFIDRAVSLVIQKTKVTLLINKVWTELPPISRTQTELHQLYELLESWEVNSFQSIVDPAEAPKTQQNINGYKNKLSR